MHSLSTALIMAFLLWGSLQVLTTSAGDSQLVSSMERGDADGGTCDKSVVVLSNCNCKCCYTAVLNGQLATIQCANINKVNGTINVLGVPVPILDDACKGGCASGQQCGFFFSNVNILDPSKTVIKTECCDTTESKGVLKCTSGSQCVTNRYTNNNDSSANFCCGSNYATCKEATNNS